MHAPPSSSAEPGRLWLLQFPAAPSKSSFLLQLFREEMLHDLRDSVCPRVTCAPGKPQWTMGTSIWTCAPQLTEQEKMAPQNPTKGKPRLSCVKTHVRDPRRFPPPGHKWAFVLCLRWLLLIGSVNNDLGVCFQKTTAFWSNDTRFNVKKRSRV